MNKKLKIFGSKIPGEEILNKILEKILRDFDDYLFGKTEVRCLAYACLALERGEVVAVAFTPECEWKQIEEQTVSLAKAAAEKWMDKPELVKDDQKYDFGRLPIVLGEFDDRTIKIFGLGFCVDGPYGQEAMDVLRSIASRAERDYRLQDIEP
jgi:hypothetical protein